MWLLFLMAGVGDCSAQEGLVISEVLADNYRTIKDDFGESSDYIEIYNGSAEDVPLAGYYLTDNPSGDLHRWQFPATNLMAGHHLLIWASGHDRRKPGQPLHTNFSLDREGEEIALIHPDGVSQVARLSFGPQQPDQSYGLEAQILAKKILLNQNSVARYLVPTNNSFAHTNHPPQNRWTSPLFNDANWLTGTAGLGFDTNQPTVFAPFTQTDTGSLMQKSRRTSLYTRVPFSVPDIKLAGNPTLQIRYDDGFVAYINGVEFARRGVSPTAVLNASSVAQTNRSNATAIIPESVATFRLSQNLQQGDNLLAIHGLNRSASDPDFLIQPEITASVVTYGAQPESVRHFSIPTPGTVNSDGFAETSGEVTFSSSSTTYFEPFYLKLAPKVPTSLGLIRYTINGSPPTTNSLYYSGPIQITNSVQIRARLFEPDALPGPITTAAFMRLDSQMRTVSSDLPLVLVHSLGSGQFDQTSKRSCVLFVHEPIQGRASFTNMPRSVFRAGLKIRGSSTAGNPKYNWAVDAWDEFDRDLDIGVLGMPKASEWVFHAPFFFDPSLLRNPLAHQISMNIGRYAPRYRFAEVYLNEARSTHTNSIITPQNYFGLYNIMERIGIGPNRVDIDELRAVDTQAPELSGGYLLSIDREFGGSPGFSAAGQTLNYIEPKYEEISLPERDAQKKYIARWFDDFGKSLGPSTLTNPVTGYTPLLDIAAAIDHHLINVIAFNEQALRLSGYFYKPRNGPLTFGPVWDFDRALGSTDGRDANPLVWKSQTGDGGTDYFNYPWWDRLFRDPNFWQAYIDRYQELREGPLSSRSLMSLIDSLNDQVAESAERDFARWKSTKRGGSQATEIAHLKSWLKKRLYFMDTNFLSKPFVDVSGASTQGLPILRLRGEEGSTIYYTLDGTDPRALHGGINASAKIYSELEPIVASTNEVIIARCYNISHRNLTGAGNPPINSPWSGPAQWPRPVSGTVTPSPTEPSVGLVVSEALYSPSPPSPEERSLTALQLTSRDFEFLELRNEGTSPIDLKAARFTTGIEFQFAASNAVVAPGEIVLLVSNLDAFRLRYGNSATIRGVYSGSLSNQVGRIALSSLRLGTILDVEYQRSKNPLTETLGFSLIRSDESSLPSGNYHWMTSTRNGGSPGGLNPKPDSDPKVVINEVVANTPGGRADTVELHNPSSKWVDLTGWVLTDYPSERYFSRFPAGTVIPPDGFLLLTEADFPSFALDEDGETIWLMEADRDGKFSGYVHTFSYGESQALVSWGRELNSLGEEMILPQRFNTPGLPNSGPKTGPLVIHEVFHHSPKSSTENTSELLQAEFIELQNISGQPFSLLSRDEIERFRPWRISGTFNFPLPLGLVLGVGETILIVTFDPDLEPETLGEFQARYGLPPELRVLGPMVRNPSERDFRARVEQPGKREDFTDPSTYLTVDEVNDELKSPWLRAADGLGASIQQRSIDVNNLDPGNWIAAIPSPGREPDPGEAPTLLAQPQDLTSISVAGLSLTVEASGSPPLHYRWLKNGIPIEGANGATLPIAGNDTSEGLYSAVVFNAHGSVVSREARVLLPTIQEDPGTVDIVLGPDDTLAREGATIQLAVGATGIRPLSYQWYFNDIPMSNATYSSLIITNASSEHFGQYQVHIRDARSSATSRVARVSRLETVQFVQGPQTIVALVGDSVQFEVQVTGSEPFGYRWRKGLSAPANSTNRIYRIPQVQLTHAGTYRCMVNNPATLPAGVASPAGVLTVMTDVDHDGMGDEWELAQGFSSEIPTDGAEDADGDGMSNAQEFRAGTDPRNAASRFAMQLIESGADGIRIGFQAAAERSYSLQFRESQDAGDWQSIVTVPGRTNEGSWTILDPLPASSDRWYRLLTPSDYRAASDAERPTVLSSPKR